ncbi:MAG: sporulation protein [Crocinitomicaceae bacterium]|nr:sporulation protein [Crocinitomicaceae bacterium]
MGFFQKIKSKLGIGGVKISIDTPGQISKEDGKVAGKFTLTTKSEQEITEMTVSLIEKYTTGRGDDETTKEFTLGKQNFKDLITIKPGDSKVYDFDFTFEALKSRNDELKDKGGVSGAIGSLGKFANKEKSEFVVDVSVDVKAAALDPTEEVDVKLV